MSKERRTGLFVCLLLLKYGNLRPRPCLHIITIRDQGPVYILLQSTYYNSRTKPLSTYYCNRRPKPCPLILQIETNPLRKHYYNSRPSRCLHIITIRNQALMYILLQLETKPLSTYYYNSRPSRCLHIIIIRDQALIYTYYYIHIT